MAGVLSFADIKFASLDATADGDNTVIAAVAGKKIRVLAYTLTQTAAGITIWKSGAATTIATQTLLAQTPSNAISDPDIGIFETAVGAALVINNAAGVDSKGSVSYVLLDVNSVPA